MAQNGEFQSRILCQETSLLDNECKRWVGTLVQSKAKNERDLSCTLPDNRDQTPKGYNDN